MKKKVIKKRPVKLATAKQVLAVLKKFYNNSDVHPSERGDLWAVLTGLRGPDSGDGEHKMSTTAVIRSTVFGDNAIIPATMDDDTPASVEIRRSMKLGVANHFEHHARQAFDALGLSWNDLNPTTRS